VDTPTVGIFGPASVSAWAPRGEQHVVVHKNLSCIPCDKKGCEEIGVSKCLEELTVDEVISAVKRQIDK
jgi:heptosyltransferase-3